MFLLGEGGVKKALDLKECLEVNRKALISICQGEGVVPSRLGLPYPKNDDPNLASSSPALKKNGSDPDDWTLIKPAAFYSNNDERISIGMKVVSVRAKNPSNNFPLVPATILLVDPPSGIVQATVSGNYITVARTSAGPALAVQMFKPNVQHLVLFGAGAQAECHIELMELALQRRIPKITIINRTLERAQRMKDKLNRGDGIQVAALSDSAKIVAALRDADVVAATTNTTTPLWAVEVELKHGCLITGIGSYTPDMQEIPDYVVDDSHVIIDTPEAMSVGDLQHLGSYESSDHPITRAGDAFQNPASIGKSAKYVFYKAVGTAIQDVLTAEAVIKSAKEKGIGQEFDMML